MTMTEEVFNVGMPCYSPTGVSACQIMKQWAQRMEIEMEPLVVHAQSSFAAVDPIDFLLSFREAKISLPSLAVYLVFMLKAAERLLAYPRALPIELKGIAV